MQPDEILKNQLNYRHTLSQDGKYASELSTYLQITIANSYFVIPISEVGEVSEFLPIRPYPSEVAGHVGVINLRGKVIPVISMEQFGGRKESKPNSRIVILNTDTTASNSEQLALIVDSVKKISAPSAESGNVITLDNNPVRVLSGGLILESWGIKPCSR
ncbi:MAG TPA: chemotaxis protein CheW [Oligoflexia bacterium]|nr:chemotaxis protein CheW [Oligoflexia bacterium]